MQVSVAVAGSDTVRLQLKWWHQFQFAGYYAAEKKGFYKQAHLNVKILAGDVRHYPIDEVLAGRAEFGITGSDLLENYANGKPVMALGAIFQHSPYAIISLRDKNIHAPSDLVGKKIMMAENQGWVEVQAMCLQEGIPISSLQIQTHSWSNLDLLDGKVDAMTAYSSVELNQLKKTGADAVYMEPVNYGIDFYGDILFSLRKTAENDPELVSRFRDASFKGWEYAMLHPDEMADYILTLPGVKKRGITKNDLLNEAEAMRKLILPELVEIGHMNEGRWKHILDIHKSLHLIARDVQLDGFLYHETRHISYRFQRAVIYASVAILSLLFVIILYSISLRSAIKKRTKELEEEMTQRTRTQQQLQSSEERLEMATDAAGLGIWDWNIETGQVYYNDIWKKMLGYEPGELQDTYTTFEKLLHPEEKEALMAQLYDHIDGKKSNYRAMLRMRTKDKRWKWILTISKAGQRNSEGKAVRLAGIHLDVDEIKQKEIELNELSQELMNSNRELQQFAYITSHNLRAPVANLISLMRLFDQTDLSEKNRLFLQKIDLCITKLNITLDDLNEILSSRVNKADTQEKIFFEEQLQSVLHSISEEIKEKKAVVTYNFTRVPSICYAKKMIDSIFINLLTNALKYSKDNEPPVIHITTEDDGAFVILSVKDNGVGLDMEKYGHKIFGLYQRFHENKEGKGLGLYIVKNQVESLEGKIAVESIVGKGTMFHVFLKKIVIPYDA